MALGQKRFQEHGLEIECEETAKGRAGGNCTRPIWQALLARPKEKNHAAAAYAGSTHAKDLFVTYCSNADGLSHAQADNRHSDFRCETCKQPAVSGHTA
jgi:hypothetical protein